MVTTLLNFTLYFYFRCILLRLASLAIAFFSVYFTVRCDYARSCYDGTTVIPLKAANESGIFCNDNQIEVNIETL